MGRFPSSAQREYMLSSIWAQSWESVPPGSGMYRYDGRPLVVGDRTG